MGPRSRGLQLDLGEIGPHEPLPFSDPDELPVVGEGDDIERVERER
jgi:hypothetical protein